jgi:hypothetical protein
MSSRLRDKIRPAADVTFVVIQLTAVGDSTAGVTQP